MEKLATAPDGGICARDAVGAIVTGVRGEDPGSLLQSANSLCEEVPEVEVEDEFNCARVQDTGRVQHHRHHLVESG